MTQAVPPGATFADWRHFDLALGLGTDLLPVVCNHGAEISANSSLKKLGKVPSQYNRQGQVVGFSDWPLLQASDGDIARWTAEPDYGISLQTRLVRGIDVDVPDPAKADAIKCFIDGWLLQALPMRFRSNSGKFLLAFRLPGDLSKAEFPVDGGIIEFLANGQQFVAVGMHESGVPYEWSGGLPCLLPELSLADFQALWQALIEEFATGAESDATSNKRKRGPTVSMPDETSDFLRSEGLVLAVDKHGSLLIKCPWDDQHSDGTAGDGSTVYFPAGTNTYQNGHFKCLHAHCRGRTDNEFISALGVITAQFAVVTALPSAPAPWPAFKRDRQGRILSTIPNVSMALRRSDICGYEIGLDLFKDEIMQAPPGTMDWVPFKDADYTRIRLELERIGFKPVGREVIRDVVCLVADDNQFDSARIWLESLTWDGVPRVEDFLHVYMGAEDSPYTRAVSSYMWSAMAGRVMEPGVKCDMAPILVGAQGVGKSSGVAAMVPSINFFTEISFVEKEDDLARRMRGRLVAEIGELRGLNTKDLESIKAFVSRQQESWVPKYREFAVNYLRRIVFIGTTNADEFLADETGNRRFLPVKTTNVNVANIGQDCLQLWAEARDLFALVGIQWRGMENLVKDAHAEHTITDPWQGLVNAWLDEPYELTGIKPIDRPHLRSYDVLVEGLRFDPKNIGKREEMRIGKVLRARGFTRKKAKVGGVSANIYVPPCSDLVSSKSEFVGAHGCSVVPTVPTFPTCAQ